MENNYLKQIKQLLADNFGIEPHEVTEDAFFEDDLNLGEYELLELMSELEEMYQVEFEKADKDELDTVGSLISLLRDKID